MSGPDQNDQKPEVVVVTGASTGVGRATVQEFAKAGAWIGLLARGREGLEGAARDVESAGGIGGASPRLTRSFWLRIRPGNRTRGKILHLDDAIWGRLKSDWD